MVVGFLSSGCVHATNGPPAGAVMPSDLDHASTPETFRQAASDLFGAMDLAQVLATSIDVTLQQQLDQNPGLRPFEEVMREFLSRYMTLDAMGEPLIALYTDRFSELELRQMAWFYRTPVGQRSTAELPELMRRSVEIGIGLVEEHKGELEDAIRSFVRQHPEAQQWPPPPVQ